MIDQLIKENVGIDDHEFPGYQHHDGLWFGANEHNSYYKLAERIYQLYPSIKNILEIGSGAGSLSHWLRWLNREYEIVTVDGNRNVLDSPYIINNYHFVIRTDQDYNLVNIKSQTIEFDLVLCYEHLEHIQRDALPKWFEMLNKHTHKDSVFLGSASTLDYNPRVHVTLESKEWWQSKFNEYGWDILDVNALNIETKPFNFELGNTNELTFIKR